MWVATSPTSVLSTVHGVSQNIVGHHNMPFNLKTKVKSNEWTEKLDSNSSDLKQHGDNTQTNLGKSFECRVSPLIHNGSTCICNIQESSNNCHVCRESLTIKDLSYVIEEKKGRWWQGGCCKKRKEKVILNEISLQVHVGEVTAILGNSGSGKTSILNILSNRTAVGKISGSVKYCNNLLSTELFRDIGGYVLQSDNHMANLTVKETLMFVAWLKYSGGDETEVSARVEQVISQTCLRHLTDCVVGGMINRGLSGGEKRRLSIAIQLIQDPAVLLLDEPTTGLDSFTAHSIVQTLSDLAKQYNKIVLLSIHQPRSDIFKLFDRIGILSQGEMVYYGPRSELVNYFTEIGYPCPTYANPLDHYVDLASIDRRNDLEQSKTTETVVKLRNCYQNSNLYLRMISEMGRNDDLNITVLNQAKEIEQCTYFKKTTILLKRMNVNIWRSKMSMFGRVFQMVTFATIIYLFMLNKLVLDYSGIQDRTGLFYETSSGVPIIGLLSAIALFPALRDLYYRERADGLYKGAPFLTAYYIHIFPFHLLSSFIFAIWIYWGVGCYPDVGRFFVYYAVVLMVQYIGELFAVLFLCVCDSVALAQSLTMLFFTINFTLASGFLRTSSEMLKPLQWLQYLSFNKYISEILMANEYHNLTFHCSDMPGNECDFTGDDYLDQFFPESVDRIAINFVILSAFIGSMWIVNMIAYKVKGERYLS